MNDRGFIVLMRKMLESWFWQLSPTDFKIGVTCLFMANWSDGKWFDGQEMVFIPRGSFITSVDKISKKAGKGISDKMVRGCLRRLETAEFLKTVTQRGKRYSFITILNYEEYQTPDKADGQTDGRSTGELGANSGRTQGELRATIEPYNHLTREPGNQELPLGDEPPSSEPEPVPGWQSLSAAKRKKLAAHLDLASKLWAYQNHLRGGELKGTAERLLRIAERLEAGATKDECKRVLEHYAAEAKRNPSSARWFNGETNWRPQNFDRALGSATPQPTATEMEWPDDRIIGA